MLDDIIVVTKGSKEEHKKELIDVLTRLEKGGYRLSENKSEFFKTEIEWITHKIDQAGIRTLQDKLLAIKELKQTKKLKRAKNHFWEPFNTYQNILITFPPKPIA